MTPADPLRRLRRFALAATVAAVALAAAASPARSAPAPASTDPACIAGATLVPPVADPACADLAGATAAPSAPAMPAIDVCDTGLIPTVDDQCEQWTARWDHAGGRGTLGIDMVYDAEVSADGALLYVTGQSWGDQENAYDVATIAYDVTTGAPVWQSRWAGPGAAHDIPQDMVLSPDGRRLYITGHAHMSPVGEMADYGTIALDASSGELLWEATYDGPDAADEAAYGAAVSPDGRWVYVTGKSGFQHQNVDYATVAYRADTGEQAWVARYSSTPGAGEDIGVSLVAAPDGRSVYVTGAAAQTITTIAYRAGDAADAGTQLWRHTHAKGYGYWSAISPDGGTVFVSASKHHVSAGLDQDWEFAAIAIDAATGAERWMTVWGTAGPGLDVPFGHALSPSGDRLVLTGSARGPAGPLDADMATLALDTADGRVAWSARTALPGHDVEGGGNARFAPDGGRVYVTGWGGARGGRIDLVTLAHGAADGTQAWIARWNTGIKDTGFADSVRVTPDGRRVLVAGYTNPLDTDAAGLEPGYNIADYVVAAYAA